MPGSNARTTRSPGVVDRASGGKSNGASRDRATAAAGSSNATIGGVPHSASKTSSDSSSRTDESAPYRKMEGISQTAKAGRTGETTILKSSSYPANRRRVKKSSFT